MADEVMKLVGITKKFKNRIILDNIDLVVFKKEILGLTGPSGAGKTVLIKILMGYLKPEKGKIISKNKIGFSTQENSFYEDLTLNQNLNYFAKMYNVKKRKEKIKVLIKTLGLDGYEKTIVGNLSGGTKKRVDIACALLNDPDILILDEPYVGLDHLLITQLSSFLDELRKSGMTMIMSSHVLEPIEQLCDRVIFIKDTKVSLIDKKNIRESY